MVDKSTGGVAPNKVRAPLPSNTPCGYETFKPSHDSLAYNPCLASVQEDRLHDCLVELCTSPRRCIFSAHHLSVTRAHIPRALQSWLCTACMSWSSCKSRRPSYLYTLTFSSTSPCTVNCLRKASTERTSMSRWWHCYVPTRHSFVLMCAGYRGSSCIPQRGHRGYLPSFGIVMLPRGCRS